MVLDLGSLKKQRAVIKAKLTRFQSFVNQFTPVSGDFRALRLRYEECTTYPDKFDDVQFKIDMQVDGGDTDDSDRQEFEDTYYKSRAEAQALLDSHIASGSGSSYKDETVANLQQPARLPEIKLPTFDGKYDEWLSFKDIFQSVVESNKTLSDVDKFRFLKSSLRGEAARVISSIAITNDNYATAWNKIVSRYQDKEGIVLKHVKHLFELETVHRESHTALRELADDISNHLAAIQNLDETDNLTSRLLVHLISSKLDAKSKREWETHVALIKAPTVQYMLDFLINRSKFIEKLSSEKPHTEKQLQRSRHVHQQNKHSVINYMAIQKPTCGYCNNQHFIHECENFKSLPHPSKINAVKQFHLCFNCLKRGHSVNECKLSKSCKRCHKRHHTLLHVEISTRKNEAADSIESVGNVQVVAHCSEQRGSAAVLATATVLVKGNTGTWTHARVVLDSGSQSCFISDELCNKLNLPRTTVNIPVIGINQGTTTIHSNTQVSIRSRVSDFEMMISCLVMERLTAHLPSESFDISKLKIPPHIILADMSFNVPQKIDLLIGANWFWTLLEQEQIPLQNSNLLLKATKLGFVVSGSHDMGVRPIMCNLSVFDKLNTQVERFWEIERCDHTRPILSREHSICEQHYAKTTRRTIEGRFVVNIPFKANIADLGTSYQTALRRFYSLENKLGKSKDLQSQYVKFMAEYIQLGHMTRLARIEPDNGYFLPHHSVINPNSTTSKLRVVFHASTASSTGLTLNDVQMTGPALQADIVSILIRFRQHKFVLKADITKMYRQILVSEEQRKYQKVLWRDNKNQTVQAYQLNTVTYGTSSAPYLAIRTIKQIAIECKERSPMISNIIDRDMFVDDLLTGTETITHARKLKLEISEIFRQAGFQLHKWESNEPRVVQKKQGANRPTAIGNQDEEIKTLGVCWNSCTDHVSYDINMPTMDTVSKRTILSTIASIYDPFGLIGPIVLVAKIIMQKLWQLSIGWDDPVPITLKNEWTNFIDGLADMRNIAIPRRIMCDNPSVVEIHGFCDSSEQAYGACIYVKSVHKERSVQISLVCAKSRVAPLKIVTLPRLELCGAVLLARLYKLVSTSLTIRVHRSVFWTDSSVALAWIRGCPTRWKQFIAHRVSEIQEKTNETNWRHVPTSLNPADIISRGSTINPLINSSLWWHGPPFLQQDESLWPVSPAGEPLELPEQKLIHAYYASPVEATADKIIERFSSFTKLVRVIAYAMRFVANCKLSRLQSAKICGVLNAQEMCDAEMILIRAVQQMHFGEDITRLKRRENLRTKSTLLSLSPFIDERNILRVGGRIRHANYSPEKKHPALLPSKHHFTTLIIRHSHEQMMHAGVQGTLAAIRQKYWPIAGRTSVKREITRCVKCVRTQPVTIYPKMGDLPKNRLEMCRTFSHTGVDFAGPLLVREGRYKNARLSKVYVALFICMTTKAIHIELVSSLTTEAFIATFHRFTARRGLPSDMYSDNAKNFRGAHNELNKMHSLVVSESANNSFKRELANRNIKWHFIPPRTPHMGGLWESAIKNVKNHIKRVAGNAHLTSEALTTLLTQIEAILNSRPLTPISNDPNDLSGLTPGHFLIGDSLLAPPHPSVCHIRDNRLSQWQHIQKLRQHFWARWTKEYISGLQHRYKWTAQRPNLQRHQLVLLKEDNLPPLRWPLGRIVDLHPGPDGIVRVISVKTVHSVLKRSVTSVCALPVEPECSA